MIRKSTKIYASVSAMCLAASICLFVFSTITVSNQKKEHLTHAQERAEAKVHKESLQTLMKTLDETQNERESLFTRFVREEEVIDFLALIEAIGKEQGVELSTKSLQVNPINNYFETLNINVSVTGTYAQVIKVLSLFEELPYQVSIPTIQVQQNDDKLWSGTITLNVTKFTKHEN